MISSCVSVVGSGWTGKVGKVSELPGADLGLQGRSQHPSGAIAGDPVRHHRHDRRQHVVARQHDAVGRVVDVRAEAGVGPWVEVRGWVTEEELDRMLDVRSMTRPPQAV